jgi:hypothetical protein
VRCSGTDIVIIWLVFVYRTFVGAGDILKIRAAELADFENDSDSLGSENDSQLIVVINMPSV